MRKAPYGLLLLVLGASLVLAAAASLALGSADIEIARIPSILAASQPSPERTILLDLRLPRTLLAVVVGAGLASAGTAYQGLFRNPLADPFVIGASSGAALGAAVAVLAGWTATPAALPVLAFAGALGAVGLVYLLGGSSAGSSPLTLLLAGAAVGTVVGALVSLLMILYDESLAVLFRWLLGGLATAGWQDVGWAAPIIAAGIVGTWLLSRPLDAFSLGDETVRSLGLSLPALRLAVVLTATITTAAAVATTGVIGFVGLVTPHGARLLVGARHGRLLPVASLLGALLLLVADGAARTLAAPQEIPVGILTALLGGPFFLLLLRRQGRSLGGPP